MANEGGPDRSLCFGDYRNQSVSYALANCLSCPKMKACVRATWGVDQPRREARSRSRYRPESGRRGRRPPPWPSAAIDLLPT